jgi:hypothetical protein
MNEQKLDDYFEEFIKVAIKSREHLGVFLDQIDTMTQAEKEYIFTLWDFDKMENEDLGDMSKLELEDYALKEFDVDIDRRRNLSDLIEQVIELKENKED